MSPGRERGPALTVRVLGPFDVRLHGRPVALTTSRLRAVLAVLAMSGGRTVPIDRLVAAVWGDQLPAEPRRAVQIYVARLRRILGAELIGTGPAGYALAVDPDDVDALRFPRLLDAALAEPDRAVERARLVAALASWRGAPFEGVRSRWLDEYEAPGLIERYLIGVERRIDLDIAAGRHLDLLPELSELTSRYPLRESLWVRRLVVLQRSGRQAEALSLYESVRRRIAEELGVDPGRQLQRVHADLLAGRGPVPGDEAMPPGPWTAPRQLPPDLEAFTGRDHVLKRLDAMLPEAGDDARTAPVILTLHGAPGVGKTSLAVHWARRVAAEFPDGQVWVDLRGFDPRGPLTPEQALTRMLRSVGHPDTDIPLELDELSGLYRTLTDGRRMLIVLDNAHRSEQVSPLLPGSPVSVVLVTSRDPLSGLVATQSAHPFALDMFTPAESHDLLARRITPDRLVPEPDAVEEIVGLCAGLPLAVAIVAARVAAHPGFSLAAIAEELRRTRGTLDGYATEGGADLRTVFSWSYRALSPAAARLFRLLALHPGPDLAVPAAASLAGTGEAAAPLLAELTRAHLLTEHQPGRYAMHDLLRAYATELGQAHDGDAERGAATDRMLAHYAFSVYAATRRLGLDRFEPSPVALADCPPDVTPVAPANGKQAVAWLLAEQPVLLAVLDSTVAAGPDTVAWSLAWLFARFLHRRGRRRELLVVQGIAGQVAERMGDPLRKAQADHLTGSAYTQVGRLDEALVHLDRALARFGRLGSASGQGYVYGALANVSHARGEYLEALHHTQRSLDLNRAADYPLGIANALNNVGWRHAQLGNYDDALRFCLAGLRLTQRIGDRSVEAITWDSIGYVQHRQSRYAEAIASYERALELIEDTGESQLEGAFRMRLGDAHMAAGAVDAARATWRQALTIFDDLAHPEADAVRALLDEAR